MDKIILKPSESTKDEVRRMILEEVDFILESINDKEQNINKKIHEIRKALKMIRAILRMVRDSAGYSVYYRENVFFRDLSRQLSVARDNQVLLQRAKVAHKNMPAGIKNTRSDELINELALNREKSLKELAEGNNVFKTISDELNRSTSRIDNLKIKNEGFKVIEKGIERIYKQAQKYLLEIEKNPDPETIHNFRKRVKYLWYQMMILKPIYSRMLKAYCKSLEKISEEFGLHRDYTLFRHLMEDNKYFGLNKKQIDFIRDFTDKEQNKIFAGAIEPSKKFFIESPDDFVKKLKNYYELSLTMSVI